MRDLFFSSACLFENFFKSKTNLLIVFLFFIITGFLSPLVPPFQSPDEQDHLKRAYLLSKGRIAMETPEGVSTGGFINDGLSEYAAIFLRISGKQHEKITLDMLDEARSIRWSQSENFHSAPGVSYYFPIIYSPQALGLFLGQTLDLSVHHSYYLARTLATLTIFVLLLASFNVRTPGPLTIALLSMPLVFFQSVTTSQDGITTALIVCCISLFLKLMQNENCVTSRLYAAFLIALLLLVTSRVNLFPMLLLPFVLSYKYKKPYMAYLSVAVTCCAVVWVLYAMTTTTDMRVSLGAKPSELLWYYIQHPLTYLNLVIVSLSHHQLGEFYIYSFVGLLGWLDAGISKVAVYYLYLLLGLLLILSLKTKGLSSELGARTALLVVAVASFLLVFLMLLITWTPHPAELIQGVQGRYFWAPAIILSMAITAKFDDLDYTIRTLSIVLLTFVVVLSIINLINTTLHRYYVPNGYVPELDSVGSQPIEYFPRNTLLNAYSDITLAPAGHIDRLYIGAEQVIIDGWGLFSQDEKEFYSNQNFSYEIAYTSVPRPDVQNATKNPYLGLSGFHLTIPVEQFNEAVASFGGICLYTKDPLFGVHRLQAGSEISGYKCGDNKHESE